MKKCISKYKRRKGSAYIYVLVVFVFISLLSAVAINVSRWNLHDTVLQQQRMKAYYLTRSGIDVSLAALLQEDVNGYSLIQSFSKYQDPSGSKKLAQTIEYKAGAEVIGTSKITAKSITEVNAGKKERWIQVDVNTEIPDIRASADDTHRKGINKRNIVYGGSVKVLVENPLFQKFDVSRP